MKIKYSEIEKAVNDDNRGGGHYPMSLTGEDAKTVQAAVNQGIDSHLEACFVSDRDDTYKWNGHRLECSVSAKSLPVLLRRLTEMEYDEKSESEVLAGSILGTLGFDAETGCFEVVPDTEEE